MALETGGGEPEAIGWAIKMKGTKLEDIPAQNAVIRCVFKIAFNDIYWEGLGLKDVHINYTTEQAEGGNAARPIHRCFIFIARKLQHVYEFSIKTGDVGARIHKHFHFSTFLFRVMILVIQEYAFTGIDLGFHYCPFCKKTCTNDNKMLHLSKISPEIVPSHICIMNGI